MVFEWSIFATVGIGGLVRAGVGWAKNSLSDGAIQSAEWFKLLETTIFYFGIGALAAMGSSLGADNMEIIGLGAAFLAHEVWNGIKKLLDKKKSKKK